MSCCCSALRDEATHEVGQAVQPKPYRTSITRDRSRVLHQEKALSSFGFPAGFEPATDRLSGDCSTKMSYGKRCEREGNRTPDLGLFRARALPVSYSFIAFITDMPRHAHRPGVGRTREGSEPRPLTNIAMTNSVHPASRVSLSHAAENVAARRAAETPSGLPGSCDSTG